MKTIAEIQRYLEIQRKKYYLKSFFRKAKRFIADFAPLDSIKNNSAVDYKIVRDQQISQTFLPKFFYEQQEVREVTLNPVALFGLKDYYVSMDSTAFISSDFKKIFYEEVEPFSTDFNILYNTKTLAFHSHHLVKANKLPIKNIDKEVVFLSGTFYFNYFHFLIEILSKIEFLDQIPQKEKLFFAVNIGISENENMKTLLSFFVPLNRVIFLKEDHFYQFSKIWNITYPNVVVPNIAEGETYLAEFVKFSKNSIQYLQRKCLENFDLHQVKISKISRIFLARKSKFRKYNEDEVFAVAADFGFEKVFLEDLNIHEQIFLMQNADYIIGPSGAAWTNLLFCKKNKTKGLLWIPKIWAEFSVFSTLAEFCDVDLYQHRFDAQEQSFHGDYEMNVDDFKTQLQKLFSI